MLPFRLYSILVSVEAFKAASLAQRDHSAVLLSNDIDLNMFEETKKISFRFIFPTLGEFRFVAIKHDVALIAFCKSFSVFSGSEDFLQSLSLLVMANSNRFLFSLKMNPRPGV